MSVDLLRRAAAKLRDIAYSCEPGTWSLDEPGKGHAWINLPGYRHAWGMHGFVDECRYVALMHPPVALALAEVLEGWAGAADATEKHLGYLPEDYLTSEFALARAILREES